MDYYSAHVIARLEHAQRIRSLPRVEEFGLPQVVSQRLPLWQMLQRWLRQQGSRLVVMAKRMLQQPSASASDSQQHGREAQV